MCRPRPLIGVQTKPNQTKQTNNCFTLVFCAVECAVTVTVPGGGGSLGNRSVRGGARGE